jgi:hypothetical protein
VVIFIKNKYEIKDDYVIIYVLNNKNEKFKIYIDKEDFDLVNRIGSWHVKWFPYVESYYARTTIYSGIDINGKYIYKTLYMHRLIMNIKDDDNNYHIDHINHDTLDNRKYNLKYSDCTNNAKNRLGANRNTTSGERNVCWITRENKWRVQLQVNGKNKVFGDFEYNDLDKAIVLARQKREKYYK